MKIRYLLLFIVIVAVAPGFVGNLCQQLAIGVVDAASSFLHGGGASSARTS